MMEQTKKAIEQADAVFFTARREAPARCRTTAPSPIWSAARASRSSSSPTRPRAKSATAGVLEAHALGLGDPVAISAEHGEGLVDLFEALREALPER